METYLKLFQRDIKIFRFIHLNFFKETVDVFLNEYPCKDSQRHGPFKSVFEK